MFWACVTRCSLFCIKVSLMDGFIHGGLVMEKAVNFDAWLNALYLERRPSMWAPLLKIVFCCLKLRV